MTMPNAPVIDGGGDGGVERTEDNGSGVALLNTATGAARNFANMVRGIQTDLLLERDALLLEKEDWLREKNSLYTQIMSLNKRLSDCQERDCGSDSILSAEDLAAVLTGEAKPPDINPDGGGPS